MINSNCRLTYNEHLLCARLDPWDFICTHPILRSMLKGKRCYHQPPFEDGETDLDFHWPGTSIHFLEVRREGGVAEKLTRGMFWPKGYYCLPLWKALTLPGAPWMPAHVMPTPSPSSNFWKLVVYVSKRVYASCYLSLSAHDLIKRNLNWWNVNAKLFLWKNTWHTLEKFNQSRSPKKWPSKSMWTRQLKYLGDKSRNAWKNPGLGLFLRCLCDLTALYRDTCAFWTWFCNKESGKPVRRLLLKEQNSFLHWTIGKSMHISFLCCATWLAGS